MANQEIINYIQNELQRGVAADAIKQALLSNGWPEADVTEAFHAGSQGAMPAVPQTPSITALPKATQILKQAWALYTSHIGTFLGITIIPVIMVAGIGLIAVLASTTTSGAPSTATNIMRIVYGSLGLIWIVIAVLAQSVGQVALLYAVRDSEAGITIGEAYRRGFKKLAPFWWIGALMGLITLTGFVLFIVPGIIFSLWFSLSVFILIEEDLRGMNALLKSKEYTRGIIGALLWRYIFIGIIAYLVVMAIALVGFLAGGNEWVTTILNALAQLLITPLAVTYGYILYRNVRALKGNFAFTPNPSQKTMFSVFAILGPIIVVGLAVLFFFNIRRSIYNRIRNNPPAYPLDIPANVKTLPTDQFPT